MPIPPFDANSVLPPHLGDPRSPLHLSPYLCSALELCERFGVSPARKHILDGLFRFRALLFEAGITGFQWLDGSFLEDVESRERRDPKDLDVVTFIRPIETAIYQALPQRFPILIDRLGTKQAYSLDHYFVNLAYNQEALVENVRYWLSLFSHRRDGVWKGMLRLELIASDDDQPAVNFLGRPA